MTAEERELEELRERMAEVQNDLGGYRVLTSGLSRRVAELEAENRQLRHELGRLMAHVPAEVLGEAK